MTIPANHDCLTPASIKPQPRYSDLRDFPLRDPGQFMLVRPDRYIYGVFTEVNQSAFIRALQKSLRGS